MHGAPDDATILSAPPNGYGSLDGASAPLGDSLLERPEVLLGAAFLGGLLFGALVSRRGS